jgi:hypothetical protein
MLMCLQVDALARAAQDHPWRDKPNALDKHSPAATRFRHPSPTGRLFDPPAQEQLDSDVLG